MLVQRPLKKNEIKVSGTRGLSEDTSHGFTVKFITEKILRLSQPRLRLNFSGIFPSHNFLT